MNTDYHVRIAKDSLCFCAAHFISLAKGECESLHGHDYRVAVEVYAPLNAQQYVADFQVVERIARDLLRPWDHRVLLAQSHPEIRVAQTGAEVTATFGQRRWVFPAEDCCLLPVSNTTSEALAGLLAQGLAQRLAPILAPTRVRVEIYESCGLIAVCDWRPS